MTNNKPEPAIKDYCDSFSADIKAIDDFLEHMNKHITETPLGGYDTEEESTVKITVGSKTIDLYDHAALIQSLMDALEHLKSEL